MIRQFKIFVRLSCAVVVGGAALLWSGQSPLEPQSSLVSSADARIGRPLTPMSYAGVARRTTRRAVAVGAAAGATAGAVYYGAPAPVVVAPAPAPVVCSQAVDAYGRVFNVCR